MRASSFMFLFAVALVPFAARAQTNAAPMDPAKVAEYQQRFQDGYTLEQQGELQEARAIFEKILAEQPDAKRSLLEAGRISLTLNEPQKANDYLDHLHMLVPDFPEAIELLIQANETLKHDVKVERLVREFRALRDKSPDPNFSKSPYFQRERIHLDGGAEIDFFEYFNYTQSPFWAMKAELYGPPPGHEVQRTLFLRYDADGTASMHAKDPKTAKDEVFYLAEPFYSGDKMTRVDVYQQLLAVPDYNKARAMMLVIFGHTPKPIYSQTVPPSAQ